MTDSAPAVVPATALATAMQDAPLEVVPDAVAPSAPLPVAAETPAPSWRDAITVPGGREFAESSTDLDHLVGRALEMRRKLSVAIVPPGRDAGARELADYRRKLGVPETPAGYRFDDPPGVTPTAADLALRAAFAEAFHRHAVPAETARALAETWRGVMAEQVAAIRAADAAHAEAAERALRRDWPGEDYERNRALARRAAAELFGDDYESLRYLEDKTGRYVLDDPRLLRALARVGRELGEDRIGATAAGDEAFDEIARLRAAQAEAQAAGDGTRANELYRQEQDAIARRAGRRPLVGSAGRMA